MVTLEEGSVVRQLVTQREVGASHLEEFCADGVPVGRHGLR
jgi:hypothetical protein